MTSGNLMIVCYIGSCGYLGVVNDNIVVGDVLTYVHTYVYHSKLTVLNIFGR